MSPGKGCRLTGSNAALEFPDGTFEVSQVAQGAGGFMCEAAKLDWRTDYASLTYELVEVPIDVEKGVRLLMDELGLYFGALDFAVTPEGRWVFFEVNPNGQWHWLAVKAGVPMVEAMADALQGEDL
ncbi:hypothetical protein [Kribbella sp. NBC_00359]|uniref:hypothetical protein n=1 Tax=Kribbella sp. NBC_00359 TaxID=2975966 RepID=UPI002E1E74E5